MLPSRRRSPGLCASLLALVVTTLAATACLPDKPLEDPTPVGGRPTAAASPAAAGSPGPGGQTSGATGSPAAGAPTGASAGKVGDTIKVGDIAIKVNSVDRGPTLLTISITAENTGNDVFIQPAAEFELRYDQGGTTATAAPARFGVAQPLFNGDLKRGQTETGNIAFQVPQEAQNVTLIWKAPAAQGGRTLATWKL